MKNIKDYVDLRANEHVKRLRISSASIDRIRDVRAHNSYTFGYLDAIEKMLHFLKWKENSSWIKSVTHQGEIMWFNGKDARYDKTYYTTLQIFEQYIEDMLSKEVISDFTHEDADDLEDHEIHDGVIEDLRDGTLHRSVDNSDNLPF